MENNKDKLTVDSLFTENPTFEGWLLDHRFVKSRDAQDSWDYTGDLGNKFPFLENIVIRVLNVVSVLYGVEGWVAALWYGDQRDEADRPKFSSDPHSTPYEALQPVVDHLNVLADDYKKKQHQEKLQTMLNDLFPEKLRPYPEDEHWLFMHGFTRWPEKGDVWARDMLPSAYVQVSRLSTGNWLAEWVEVKAGEKHNTLSKGSLCASPKEALLSMLDGCLKLPDFVAVGKSQETEEV